MLLAWIYGKRSLFLEGERRDPSRIFLSRPLWCRRQTWTHAGPAKRVQERVDDSHQESHPEQVSGSIRRASMLIMDKTMEYIDKERMQMCCVAPDALSWLLFYSQQSVSFQSLERLTLDVCWTDWERPSRALLIRPGPAAAAPILTSRWIDRADPIPPALPVGFPHSPALADGPAVLLSKQLVC